LIERLIYLTNTRPYITLAVHHLSQFVTAPNAQHQQVALCVLRYLKREPAQGMFLATDSEVQFKAISDSDWA